LAAISNSRAICGLIVNSGISDELFVYLDLYVKYIQTFCKTWDLRTPKAKYRHHRSVEEKSRGGTNGISLKWISLVSFSANCPGPLNMALIVPDINACSRLTMNSWPSLDISLTYVASGPSQPVPYFSSSYSSL